MKADPFLYDKSFDPKCLMYLRDQSQASHPPLSSNHQRYKAPQPVREI
jgi:hypothetical protein